MLFKKNNEITIYTYAFLILFVQEFLYFSLTSIKFGDIQVFSTKL